MLSKIGVEWRKRHERIYVKKKKDFFVGVFFAAKKKKKNIQFYTIPLLWFKSTTSGQRGSRVETERERGEEKEKKYGWTWTRNVDDIRQHQWCCLWRPDPLPRNLFTFTEPFKRTFILINIFFSLDPLYAPDKRELFLHHLFGWRHRHRRARKKGNETVYLDTSEHAYRTSASQKIYYYLSNDNLLSERVFFSFNTKITNNWKIDR